MTPSNQPPLRLATPADAPAIAELTRRAYAPWIPVIGRPPRPMAADYDAAVRAHRFDLLTGPEGSLLALIETRAEAEHLVIVNIAVDPDLHGQGIGRRLLAHAETLAAAQDLATLRLYTHGKMARNLAIYGQAGYRIEFREPLADGVGVHMAKPAAHATRHLVFLPGAGASAGFWRPLGDRLTGPHAKTYLSWPGLGDEPAAPDVNGWDDLAGLVEAAIGEGPPADLVAQSMGGYLALATALRRPDRVRRLVLTVTSGGIDTRSLGASDWRETYRREYPAAAAWLDRPVADLTVRLASLAKPALLLWGGADAISPAAVGRRLAELLPNGGLRIVPGGGHDIAVTHAAELAPVIAEHLS